MSKTFLSLKKKKTWAILLLNSEKTMIVEVFIFNIIQEKRPNRNITFLHKTYSLMWCTNISFSLRNVYFITTKILLHVFLKCLVIVWSKRGHSCLVCWLLIWRTMNKKFQKNIIFVHFTNFACFCFPSRFNSHDVQSLLVLFIVIFLKIRPSISVLSFDMFHPLSLEFCFIEFNKNIMIGFVFLRWEFYIIFHFSVKSLSPQPLSLLITFGSWCSLR